MAVAAALRTRGPALAIELEPNVPPVFGVMFVSCVTNFIWPMSMFSSSAAIIIRPTFEPCPSSTRPVFTETVLSA